MFILPIVIANILFLPPSSGFPITEEQLKDAAENSGVLQLDNDFISPEFRAKCTNILPYPDQVEPNECYDAFIYLKTNFNLSNSSTCN